MTIEVISQRDESSYRSSSFADINSDIERQSHWFKPAGTAKMEIDSVKDSDSKMNERILLYRPNVSKTDVP